MRKAFARQQRLDCPAVVDLVLNLNCRDEIVPILRALQHLYSQPQLRDDILQATATDINSTSSRQRGRHGLDYWQVLVLAAVRLGCNLDYDKLQDLAEQHAALRQLMGLGPWDQKTTFDWRRIRDNLCLLRPATIARLNQLIVAAGHELLPEAVERVRADSFVAETNIHYPSESSLIRDGLRKIFALGAQVAALLSSGGWRQHKHLYKKVKQLSRHIERIAARKGAQYRERLQAAYRELLQLAGAVLARASELRERCRETAVADALALGAELDVFVQRTRQVCDTARRRVLQGEDVPNCDKLFSIFEPHTQLYKRGKAGEPVQFGRVALVFEDAAGFVCQYHLLPREAEDRAVLVEQTRLLQNRLGGRVQHLSFDRGFHSPSNQRELAEIVAHPCLPMPGRRQAPRQAEQASVEFRQARQRHPGIESAIGALQSGNGLKRCRDRTEPGYERYLGLAILGRNLQVLGKLLIARTASRCQAANSLRGRTAA